MEIDIRSCAISQTVGVGLGGFEASGVVGVWGLCVCEGYGDMRFDARSHVISQHFWGSGFVWLRGFWDSGV